jgi:ATP-dependent Zn protease
LFALIAAEQCSEVITEPVQTFTLWSVLLNALPFLLLIGIALFFLRRTQNQGENVFSMGKSRARLYNKNKRAHNICNDVAGAEGTKRELTEVVDFLKNSKRFEHLGGEIPKGVLSGRTSRHRENPARSRRRRRSKRPLLQYHRFRFYGNVRRCRCIPCSQLV